MHHPTVYELGAIFTAAVGEDRASADEATGLESKIGVLPFTGMDLLIVGGVALLLVMMGFLLRKLSAPRGPTV